MDGRVRWDVLARASRCLADSLDYETTLATSAGLALPHFGTWCMVDIVEPDDAIRRVAVIHQKLNPLWKFSVTGTIPSDPRRPYMVVANHESFVDILLICHVPMEMKWMSKSEFFKIPLLGWGMRMAGDIPVHRGDSRRTASSMKPHNSLRQRSAHRSEFVEVYGRGDSVQVDNVDTCAYRPADGPAEGPS